MHKTHKISITILLFSSLVQTWAIDNIPNKEFDLFPVQAPLIYDASSSSVDPFRMASWSVSRNWVRYHRNIRKDIGKTAKELKWFKNFKTRNFELKTEVPYYKDRVSLGFDLGFFYDCIYNFKIFDKGVLSQVGDKTSVKIVSDKIDPDSRFALLVGANILGSVKFKLPFQTPVGRVALTFSPKLGATAIPFQIDHLTELGKFAIELGLVTGVSVGIDYYFNQWLGIYSEFSLKHNSTVYYIRHRELELLLEDILRGAGIKAIAGEFERYSYFTTSFTLGFKTTF